MLNDEFLALLGSPKERSRKDKEQILEGMVANEATTLLMIVADDGSAAGISYGNWGTGYSCGGRYLWLNCVYIRECHQRRGYGIERSPVPGG